MPHDITVTLLLPAQFVTLCRSDNVEPGTVLRGFVADLCRLTDAEVGYICNGLQAQKLASWYYAQVGYAWWPR